jgi:hypothetical protein
MGLAPQVLLPQQCPRCAALMYRENDEAWCLYCGERVFPPPLLAYPPVPSVPRQRGRPRKLRVPLESPLSQPS